MAINGQVTEKFEDVGNQHGYPRLGVRAIARRTSEPGKTASYESEVTNIQPTTVTAEDAKMLALNLQKAAEVAWRLEEELRREFDPPSARAAVG